MQIYITKARNQTGPFTAEVAREMIASGSVSPDDLGGISGAGDWKPLNSILNFRQTIVHPPIPQAETYPSKDSSKSPSGVGGWLLWFCIMLTILTPLLGSGQMANAWRDAAPAFSRFPAIRTVVVWENFCTRGCCERVGRELRIHWQMHRFPYFLSFTRSERGRTGTRTNPRGSTGFTHIWPPVGMPELGVRDDNAFFRDQALEFQGLTQTFATPSTTSLMVYGIIIGCNIWKGNPRGRDLALRYLNVSLVTYFRTEVITLALMSSLPSEILSEAIDRFFKSGVGQFVRFAIWWLYFKKSKRVRNTYGEP